MATRSSSNSYSITPTSYDYSSYDFPSYLNDTGSTRSRPLTGRTSGTRPRTRARTAASTSGGAHDQQIVCAITESRGISPIIGLAFVNISTTEAVLCQIVDNQTYVKTLHKVSVFAPSAILFPSTAIQPAKSKLCAFVETNFPEWPVTAIDRKYFGENVGVEYIRQLAFKEDIEALKVSLEGNYFAVCCLAAVSLPMRFALSALTSQSPGS